VAVLLLFIHCFCCEFGVLQEGLLISPAKNLMFIFDGPFEIKVGRASLIDDLPDMFTIFFFNTWRHYREDFINIPALTGIFTPDVTNDHACVKPLVDGTDSGQSNAFFRYFGVLRIIKPWEFQQKKSINQRHIMSSIILRYSLFRHLKPFKSSFVR
jgi:hypothetical protein